MEAASANVCFGDCISKSREWKKTSADNCLKCWFTREEMKPKSKKSRAKANFGACVNVISSTPTENSRLSIFKRFYYTKNRSKKPHETRRDTTVDYVYIRKLNSTALCVFNFGLFCDAILALAHIEPSSNVHLVCSVPHNTSIQFIWLFKLYQRLLTNKFGVIFYKSQYRGLQSDRLWIGFQHFDLRLEKRKSSNKRNYLKLN